MAYGHKQIYIEHGRNRAEVDEGIDKLILSIWQLGINTSNSCVENFPGVAWIQFDTEEDLRLFCFALITIDKYKYRDKFEFQVNTIPKVKRTGNWKIDLNISEGVNFISEDEVEGNGTIDLGYSVRFRKSEINAMTDCLNQYRDFRKNELKKHTPPTQD
jgi:hypothetical protein